MSAFDFAGRPVATIKVDLTPVCLCGYRRGLHRWGDYACPNLPLIVGSGHKHWLAQSFVERRQQLALPAPVRTAA